MIYMLRGERNGEPQSEGSQSQEEFDPLNLNNLEGTITDPPKSPLDNVSPGEVLLERFELQKLISIPAPQWRAHDQQHDHEVLLRFRSFHTGVTQQDIKALKRRSRIGEKLNHRNILGLYESIFMDEGVLLVLENASYHTLSELIEEEPDHRFGEYDTSRWMTYLSSALDYAHIDHRVFHGNLNPAWLMIDQHGILKLDGFGILGNGALDVRNALYPFGPEIHFAYTAPEHFPELGKPEVKGDVFGLGALGFWMLSGKAPFNEESRGSLQSPALSIEECLHDQNQAEPNNPNGLENEIVPLRWEEALAFCLLLNPRHRLETVEEVARRLELPLIGGRAGNFTYQPEKPQRPQPSSTVPQKDPADEDDFASSRHLTHGLSGGTTLDTNLLREASDSDDHSRAISSERETEPYQLPQPEKNKNFSLNTFIIPGILIIAIAILASGALIYGIYFLIQDKSVQPTSAKNPNNLLETPIAPSSSSPKKPSPINPETTTPIAGGTSVILTPKKRKLSQVESGRLSRSAENLIKNQETLSQLRTIIKEAADTDILIACLLVSAQQRQNPTISELPIDLPRSFQTEIEPERVIQQFEKMLDNRGVELLGLPQPLPLNFDTYPTDEQILLNKSRKADYLSAQIEFFSHGLLVLRRDSQKARTLCDRLSISRQNLTPIFPNQQSSTSEDSRDLSNDAIPSPVEQTPSPTPEGGGLPE